MNPWFRVPPPPDDDHAPGENHALVRPQGIVNRGHGRHGRAVFDEILHHRHALPAGDALLWWERVQPSGGEEWSVEDVGLVMVSMRE